MIRKVNIPISIKAHIYEQFKQILEVEGSKVGKTIRNFIIRTVNERYIIVSQKQQCEIDKVENSTLFDSKKQKNPIKDENSTKNVSSIPVAKIRDNDSGNIEKNDDLIEIT